MVALGRLLHLPVLEENNEEQCECSYCRPEAADSLLEAQTLYKSSPSSISLLSRMIMMSGLEVAMAHVAGPSVHTGRRQVTTLMTG